MCDWADLEAELSGLSELGWPVDSVQSVAPVSTGDERCTVCGFLTYTSKVCRKCRARGAAE